MKRKTQLSSFSVIIVFVCLVIIGIGFLPFLNIQLNPSKTMARLRVSYQWADASARIIEQEVTSKLEGLFSSVKGITNISSVSSKGNGYIDIEFKDNLNIDAARFEIANLVRQSYPDFPRQVAYPTISLDASGKNRSPILSYTLSASASPHFIQRLAENQILPDLSRIRGVSDVSIYGATPFEWEINYQVAAIRNLGISVEDIRKSIDDKFRRQYVGKGSYKIYPDKGISEMNLVLAGKKADSLLWPTIPIKKIGSRIIYLGDIANIRFKEQKPKSYFRINGLNTINMVVYAEPDANSIQVADKVEGLINTRIKQNIPSGYNIIKSSDSTKFLKEGLSKIFKRTIFSLVILLVFVLIISRQFRYLILIFLSIVANLIIAVVFYYLFKVEIHLYSLAGITISFGIIIDNSIVMIDHLRHHGSRHVFLAILAATLTTMGALCVIFLLDEQQRLNLIDFVMVIIINLAISMAIALFLIPALMDKLPLRTKKNKRYYRRRRRVIVASAVYQKVILFGKRFRWIYIILLIVGFGLPVHWLPEEIKGDGTWSQLYNTTFGNEWFKEDVKPVLEKTLGGTLRLFTMHVFENAHYAEPSRTTLSVRGSMPEGCTVQQLNEAVKRMENFISKFDEIEMFQTNIYNYRNAMVRIYFKPGYEFSSFPYFLKSELESKAISLGGLDWSVWGVGRGFSNALSDGYKSNRILLEGYNYDDLYSYAEFLKQRLLENNRIKEVEIAGNIGWNSNVLQEYFMDFNPGELIAHDVNIFDFYSSLKDRAYRQYLSPVYFQDEMQQVVLTSDEYEKFDVWNLNNEPISINDRLYKLAQFARIDKKETGNEIYKFNQQYRLIVAYDFIGPYQLAKIVRDDHVDQLKSRLPLGYSVKVDQFMGWDKKNERQYYLIFIVMIIIYFICAILFESLVQPLAIITLIPISFIGVFLTFYLFDINFDQGGYASFIMLAGLVVNAGLFIINDYNNNMKGYPQRSRLVLYVKAFNHKIIPIFLTILSTVMGLIPFVWGGQNEVFWFAFASGVIGGLVFSVIALVIYLPLFFKLREKNRFRIGN